MKVYILTYEPGHETSEILGVYSSLEKAMAIPIYERMTWKTEDCFYVDGWKGKYGDKGWHNCVAELACGESGDTTHLIFEYDVDHPIRENYGVRS